MSSGIKSSFVARVRDALPILHPSERRVADLVLSFPGELASYSATELAGLAHVSNATVTRFIRKIGYASFDEARQDVRAQQKSGAALFLMRAGVEDAGYAATHIGQAHANLDQTLQWLSTEEIDGIATALLHARCVWAIGTRAGRTFSEYLAFQLSQIVTSTRLVPRTGETLGEHVASMSGGDLALIVMLRRPTRRMDALIDQVRASGARIVLISDESVDRRSDLGWHLRCQTISPGPLFNHVSVLAICHLIATRTIELAGSEGRQRMSAIEVAHAALDEL